MALSAALNSNENGELPAEPKWVFWCSSCGAYDPHDAKAEAFGIKKKR